MGAETAIIGVGVGVITITRAFVKGFDEGYNEARKADGRRCHTCYTCDKRCEH